MTSEAALVPTLAGPRIRRVATDRPWVWITAGWQDLQATKAVGLAYGAAFTLFGWLVTLLMVETETIWAILPATAGFFLMGPLVATGLYETSRLRAAGQSPSLKDAVMAFRHNGSQVALIGLVLLVLHLFWVRVAGLIFALFFGAGGLPSIENLPMAMLRSDLLLPFLIIGTGFGFVLAAASFAITAVSIPMLLDRDVSAFEAITVSIQVVMENWRPMLLWAGLIVVFCGLALVPFYLGLVLVLPVVGHATWHAYRDLVVEPSSGA